MNTHPYLSGLAIGLDRFVAAIFFGTPDFTVSALCFLARVTNLTRSASLLTKVRHRALLWIGWSLDKWSPGHVGRARTNALATADRVRRQMGALTP